MNDPYPQKQQNITETDPKSPLKPPNNISKTHLQNRASFFDIKTLISSILNLHYKTIFGRFSGKKRRCSSIFVHFGHENCKMMKRPFPRFRAIFRKNAEKSYTPAPILHAILHAETVNID